MLPDTSIHAMLKRLYPYDVMLGKEGQNAVQDALSVSNQIIYNPFIIT